MGAKHVINPDQLTLFERAGDLADPGKFYPNDAYHTQLEYGYSHDEAQEHTWQQKMDENHMKGLHGDDTLYNDIAKRGIQEPVEVNTIRGPEYERVRDRLNLENGYVPSRGMLYNGHHRVYAQSDIDPKAWVPVKWSDE
jgi:hypothetical protein